MMGRSLAIIRWLGGVGFVLAANVRCSLFPSQSICISLCWGVGY
uniref:Uncharacterized protein n=1 Tax=Anguilla anguilla TaxID=7936 RepID=A0A0E9S6B7_ANGAN